MNTFRGGLSWIAPFFRIVAGGILAISGYLKAVRPTAEFAATLESYWIFPAFLVFPAAKAVPWVELLVGMALVVGFFTRGSALVAAGLYATFVAVLAQSIIRKLPMADCGCFGQVGPHLNPMQALTLDAVLLIFCLLILFDQARRFSADRWIARS
ncbi:MAG: hypothetical protein JNK54_03720 [Elusimicrobia bacterium]|jgi:uncharacterized membrane protein YphA (DoxX/SURF4 family)|nr:hypothetical protein [Elusimicrobiota bacterium]